MKRYLVFAYYVTEQDGGWNDFQDAFSTLEEAKDFQIKLLLDQGSDSYYVEIVDLEILKVLEG